jgi:hypothetical protein
MAAANVSSGLAQSVAFAPGLMARGFFSSCGRAVSHALIFVN